MKRYLSDFDDVVRFRTYDTVAEYNARVREHRDFLLSQPEDELLSYCIILQSAAHSLDEVPMTALGRIRFVFRMYNRIDRILDSKTS